MIALATSFEPFEVRYPGSGSHGITSKEETRYYQSSNTNTKPTQLNPFSITFYEPRKCGDIIIMKVDFDKSKVSFSVRASKGGEWGGSFIIPTKYNSQQTWVVLVSLCSVVSLTIKLLTINVFECS